MNTIWKRFAVIASLVILILFILFVINQTAQVVGLAEKVNPSLGAVVLWGLLILYAVLIVIPISLFLRLPRSLKPPRSEDTPEFATYLETLKGRLASNPLLTGENLSSREDIEQALGLLGKKADEIIQRSASNVFITTAISQSGRLDTFLVLSVQSRMVWRIAQLYYQRPTLRDLLQLYANVVGTAFVAGELDDIDISQQLEPILSSTLGAVALSIPGLRAASSIVISSVITGAANAFLTLRVGIVAKRYCGSLVVVEKRGLRRMATAEAAKLLGTIVKQGSARLTKILWSASKGKVSATFSGVGGSAKEAGRSFLSKIAFGKRTETAHPALEEICGEAGEPKTTQENDPKP